MPVTLTCPQFCQNLNSATRNAVVQYSVLSRALEDAIAVRDAACGPVEQICASQHAQLVACRTSFIAAVAALEAVIASQSIPWIIAGIATVEAARQFLIIAAQAYKIAP